MEGPLSLSGPLRPVPMYSRRPLGLDLSRTPLLHPPSPSIRPAPPPHSSSSSLKVKDVPLPPTSFRPPFLASLPLPARTAQPLPLVKGDNNSSSSSSSSSSGSSSSSAVEKPAGELWPLDKSGSVPLITPIQGPDLRSVVFYQSLLRHHPAYRQLLEGFLVPPFQPFLCPPLPPPAAAAAVIADVAVPFAFCTPPPPLPRHHPHHPHHHHHHHHHPNNNNNHHPLSSSVPPEEEEEDRHRRRAQLGAQLGAQLVVSPQEKKDVSSPPQPPRNSNARGDRDSGAAEERSSEPASEHHHHPRSPQGGRRECEESKCSETGCLERSPLLSTSKVDLKCSEEVMRGGGGAGGGVLSAEDLVASITAIPDPYQQYGYGRKLFPCPQCRYTTDRRNNLKRHMLTMHQLSAKMLECCGLLFRTKAALREHALIFHYHGYTCFYCARRFCRKALLKRHLSVHSGQKEFLCNVCDYATSHKSNLERHRRVHMRQDDDVSFEEDGMMMMMEDPRETSGHLSEDEISVCSHDEEDEEINVQSD